MLGEGDRKRSFLGTPELHHNFVMSKALVTCFARSIADGSRPSSRALHGYICIMKPILVTAPRCVKKHG